MPDGRFLFPDESSRFAYRVFGTTLRASAGATATIYADEDATTLADLLADYDGVPGAAIAGSVVAVDEFSLLDLFWGPVGATSLWAVIAGGPITRIGSRDTDRITLIEARMDDIVSIGRVSFGPDDPGPGLPPGTEYVWNKTDGAGTLIDIISGVAS